LSRRSWAGALLAIGGATLLHRGPTRRCLVYAGLGLDTTHKPRGTAAALPAREGGKVAKSVHVHRPRTELYYFWRDLGNLPRFMEHLQSVTTRDEARSHWVAKAPAGMSVEWEAEVYNEQEPELIAWRSLEGSDIHHAGSVHFEPAPGGRGTIVRV